MTLRVLSRSLIAMASQFYLTLPSNSSMEYFPANKLADKF